MRTLTVAHDQLMLGDKITAVDGCPVHRPDIICHTPAGWVEGSTSVHYVQGPTRLVFADTPVTVSRPETDEEREAVAKRVYDWMLLLSHNPFGEYDGPNQNHLKVLWAMYGREGEMDEEFEREIQERLDSDYDYRATIAPC